MTAIVEKERAEMMQMKERVRVLEAQNEALSQQVGEQQAGGDDSKWKREIKNLEEEKRAITEEFDRFKERTNVAMKLRGKEMANRESKHSNLEDDLRAAQQELEVLQSERDQKESELLELEDQSAQASIAVAHQLGIATTEVEVARKNFEIEKRNMTSQHRQALQELRDSYELRVSNLNKLHEEELHEMSMRVDKAQAGAIAHAQARMDDIMKNSVLLQNQVEQLTQEKEQWMAEKQQDAANTATKADTDDIKECHQRIRKLEEEKEHQSRRIWVLQREVIERKEAQGELKEKPSTAQELSFSQQQNYLKGIILNFLTARNEEIRGSLIPVLAAILQLSNSELKSIYSENPAWATI
eukprot:TRINITY_DN25336_c0_g1_i1.p1 TRINITY_DN25336_c0_g1~~TRINITY_DN25336_c0_g1_i1.p1  ORF type:complete len:411 (+),score=97.13 TRINITY_DN25336_c0_g1_i1:168-1235(+)